LTSREMVHTEMDLEIFHFQCIRLPMLGQKTCKRTNSSCCSAKNASK
jgi:hypothetical protein